MRLEKNRYISLLFDKIGRGEIRPQPGSILQVEILHDDNCGYFKDKPCDCNPDIVVCGKEVVGHA